MTRASWGAQGLYTLELIVHREEKPAKALEQSRNLKAGTEADTVGSH